MPERTPAVLITCAPPNPNGDLHLGHLAGPFLGADVLRRYLRQRGQRALYLSYTDDQSCYVRRKAEEIGRSPRQTAFAYTRRIEETLSLAGMLPDYYEHPHREAVHERLVHEHTRRLHASGALVERELPVAWCEHCGEYRYEAYVRGRCPACEQPTDGMYCEDCGRPHEPDGVRDGICIRCRNPLASRTIRRLVFELSRYADQLADYYERCDWQPRLLDYCRLLLKQGLPDVPVSRQTVYGTPVPLPGWQGHILDTWYCGIFGYMAATAAYGAAVGHSDLYQELWRDRGATIVNFIGFDCGFSHAVLWPAMLLALGGFELPRQVITNEFYNLEGEKFSTSRGHAIWGADFLREVPADAVRLHLCRTNPQEQPTSFQMAEFDATNNQVLAGRLEGWATALLDLLREDCDSTVPEPDGGAGGAARRLGATLADEVGRHLEPTGFSLRDAAARLVLAIEAADDDLRAVRLERGAPGRAGAGYRAALGEHARLLATVAASTAPLLPAWASHAWKQLRLPLPTPDPVLPWPDQAGAPVPTGQRVAAAFPRMFRER
jgi:methionyl-tRNA synthetase